jgi:hypothetical protein
MELRISDALHYSAEPWRTYFGYGTQPQIKREPGGREQENLKMKILERMLAATHCFLQFHRASAIGLRASSGLDGCDTIILACGNQQCR